MSACRLSHLEALAQALSSNDLDRARELNAVSRFLQEAFLDPDRGIEPSLRARREEHEQMLLRAQGKLPPPQRDYMPTDGLDDWDTTLNEGEVNAAE